MLLILIKIMLRKNKMDPSRINNYNKFLSTLDNISNLNNIKESESNNSIIQKIESQIEKINFDFIAGQVYDDIIKTDIILNNPNIYVDDNNYCKYEPKKYRIYEKNQNETKIPLIEIEKTLVNIDVEIILF